LKTDLQTLFITAPANAVHHLISLTQDPLASVSLQDRWNYVQSIFHFLCWKPVGVVHSSLWLAWSLFSLCWSLIPISVFLLLKNRHLS